MNPQQQIEAPRNSDDSLKNNAVESAEEKEKVPVFEQKLLIYSVPKGLQNELGTGMAHVPIVRSTRDSFTILVNGKEHNVQKQDIEEVSIPWKSREVLYNMNRNKMPKFASTSEGINNGEFFPEPWLDQNLVFPILRSEGGRYQIGHPVRFNGKEVEPRMDAKFPVWTKITSSDRKSHFDRGFLVSETDFNRRVATCRLIYDEFRNRTEPTKRNNVHPFLQRLQSVTWKLMTGDDGNSNWDYSQQDILHHDHLKITDRTLAQKDPSDFETWLNEIEPSREELVRKAREAGVPEFSESIEMTTSESREKFLLIDAARLRPPEIRKIEASIREKYSPIFNADDLDKIVTQEMNREVQKRIDERTQKQH